MSHGPALSVVIPTLNEARRLPALLSDLEALSDLGPLDAEVIVVDGGSTDGTQAAARSAGARLLETEAGRGVQLRAGAEAGSAPWLFFVHADCRLGPTAARALRRFMAEAAPDDFAHFGFQLDGDDAIHHFIELGQRLRERWLGLVYGDQGLVVSRALYDEVSGHPEWPLMEDVGIVRRLTKRGRRVALPAVLVTSARRYDEEGGLRRWMRNVMLMALFGLGVDPHRLTRWYRPRSMTPRRIVGVFAKAPTPGRVKTRLAADIGDERAAEIYRRLGRQTVQSLRGGPYRLVVFGDPPDADSLARISEWLGLEALQVRPQGPGDLGARMTAALDEALGDADQALVVGTDIPGIDQDTVGRAFTALDEHDVVVGPAVDGGYYLVGLVRPCPDLFEEIPWSTSRVLSDTLDRARSIGLSVALLDEKADVDTVDDLPPGLCPDTRAKARDLHL